MIGAAIAFALFGVICIALSVSAGQTAVLLFGIACIAAAIFMTVMSVKDRMLRKRYEENPEEFETQFEDDEEYAEYLEYAEEIEELEEFDSDSGKGYCPHCGNYAVTANRCESCGEEVIE